MSEERDAKTGQFVKGKKGGPGRPRGCRSKLGEAFLEAMHADFEEHGVAAIETVRAERPHEYLKVVAGLLPKDVRLEVSASEAFAKLIDRLDEMDARGELGRFDTGGGEEKPECVRH